MTAMVIVIPDKLTRKRVVSFTPAEDEQLVEAAQDAGMAPEAFIRAATLVRVGMDDNGLAPDGYRYGIRFDDGTVRDVWDGSTQVVLATEEYEWLCATYPGDGFELVRRSDLAGPWCVLRSYGTNP